MEKYRIIFVLGLLGVLCFGYRFWSEGTLWCNVTEARESFLQKGIAKEIIRLHVLADSDAPEAQELKLEIKDAIVKKMQTKLGKTKNIEEARKIITENLGEIEALADKMTEEHGYSYRAKASLETCDFPVKQYGDLTFPAGKYEALRVSLGEAKGKNWWCVVFPTLCYVDEAKEEISPENKEKLKQLLTEEEYESLLSGHGKTVIYKWKFPQYLNKVIDYFAN